MTICSLDILHSLFGTSLLFHVQFCFFLTCIQVSQEAGQVVWYSHLFQNFPVCCDPHSQSLWHKFSSVQFSRSVVSNSLRPHELLQARPPCPSPTPEVHPNPCPLLQWCHPTISSSVIPFLSCPQSFPASGSFPINKAEIDVFCRKILMKLGALNL